MNALLLVLRMAGLPEPALEVVFAPPRRWRFDAAWVHYRVAVEYEGGVYTRGRHVRPRGFVDDCEKYNEAAILGWLVIRVTADMVRDGRALRMIERALAAREK